MSWLRDQRWTVLPLLLAVATLGALDDLEARPRATVAILVTGAAAFAFVLVRLGASSPPRSAVLAVAALLRLCLLPIPPSLSDDVHRYLWDGRVASAGRNPYFHAPDDPALADLRDDRWERVAHREVETVYPPLAIAAFSIAARVPRPLLAWKAMLVVVDLLSCALLLRLAGVRGVPSGRALAYAWNPLVVLEVAGMGHVDALGVLPLLAGALFLVVPWRDRLPPDPATARRRSLAAGAALALAVLAKLVPVLLLVAWARAAPRRLLLIAAAAVVMALATVPFAIGAPGAPPGLVTYAVSWEWNGPLFEPLWRALDGVGAAPWVKLRLDDLKQATGHHDFWNRLYPFVYPQLLAKVALGLALLGWVVAVTLRRPPRLRRRSAAVGDGLSLVRVVGAALGGAPVAAAVAGAVALSCRLLSATAARCTLAAVALPDGVGAVPDRAASLASGDGRHGGDALERVTHRLTLAYLGTGFGGWQRQTNALSVQEVVETAIARIVGEPVRLHGASRTDAGVHARGQEAHVALSRSWPASALIEGTNHYLPPEIRVLRSMAVAPGFHARGWAMAKEYHYRMSRRRVLSPFAAPTTLRVPSELDLDRFRRGVELLEGRHDFRAFARAGGSHRQTWRRVFVADVAEHGAEVRFRIVGDGFLRGMVRAVVGTLLQVASGRLSLERWAALLEGADRAEAGPSAPACGLVLMRVVYPDETAPDLLREESVARATSDEGGAVEGETL